jgi:hypothetical protein
MLRKPQELQSLAASTPLMQQAVFEAFDQLGIEFLKPVFDRLNGAVNYDDLKILRLIYMGDHSV